MPDFPLGAAVQIYKDAKGEYRWRLKSANGELIAESGEGYTRQPDAVRAWYTVLELLTNVQTHGYLRMEYAPADTVQHDD